MSTLLDVFSDESWKLALTANYSTNGYPTIAPTVTPPSGSGVIAFGHDGNTASPHICLIPHGVGSAGNTFLMKIYGWRATKFNVIGQKPLWIPNELAEFTVTLGSSVGIVNSDLGTTTLFATSFAVTGGPLWNLNTMYPIVKDLFFINAGAAAGIGMIKFPSFGFRYLQTAFNAGTGPNVPCNSLWCKG